MSNDIRRRKQNAIHLMWSYSLACHVHAARNSDGVCTPLTFILNKDHVSYEHNVILNFH